jgi:arylsulfatase A-like enzyme/uncharacterized membrane protein YbhN (UPF0104 family)
MFVLLEILLVAILAILTSRLAPEPWKGRIYSALKAWVTVRAFWLLLAHPITMEDGSKVVMLKLIGQQLAQIEAGTFWLFVCAAAGIKMLGMLSSMYRWILVLRGQGIQLPFWHIFGSFLIGRAIGTFLPSTAGLDGYTLYDAARFTGKTVEVTAAKFLEKICGFSGIFLSYLVALPFGIEVYEQIFGVENALSVAMVTIPVALGPIMGLLLILWYPGVVQWVLENFPIPAKQRLEGIVMRVSHAASAYRDKKLLMLQVLFLSFLVHFTTAAMYYFTALAIGAVGAEFWPIVFGSSIQILATVLSPFTIAGEGIREAAQLVLVGNMIGPAAAIVSAALGFWAAEAPTMLGFVFWWVRPDDYKPAFSLVNGVQVDYDQAAAAAVSLETEEEKAQRQTKATASTLPPLGTRVLHSAGVGFGAGALAGVIIGIAESFVIARGGFGTEAQVLWYGPLAYAVFLGGLATLGGAFLGVLPMEKKEIRIWTPTLGMIATLIPFGLAITVFRLRRDVYLEQMPPAPVLLGVLAIAAVVTLLIFFGGRKLFSSPAGVIVQPLGAAVLLAVVALGGFAASKGAVSGSAAPPIAGIPRELARHPNVILVMVDTLRADHLSCYDAEGVATPNICSLAEGGGSRLDGFSHASWTKPATASLLTALLPSSHNAMSKPAKLSPDVELIAEVLQQRGYATGGIVSNINLAESFGFDQGYDEYHYLGPDYLAGAEESSSKLILYNIVRSVWFKLKPGLRFGDFYQDSEVVNEVAFDWLDRHQDSRFFLFLHYMDPHDPYFEHPYDGTAIARVSEPHPKAGRAEEMHRLYRGEIEYLDANFGKLLDKLRELRVYEDTVIALVADHGEEFYEHAGWWHGLTLYDEQIHVPLLIKWQRGDAQNTGTGIGRLIDVAPTLIARTGATVPDSMQGIDLAAPAAERSEKDREVYSEEDHEGNVLWSLRTDEMKLISANPGNPRGLPERELFDMTADPGEKNNLAGGAQSAAEEKLAQHADLQRRAAEGEAVTGGGEVEMSREECEQLMNLGYVTDCSHIN